MAASLLATDVQPAVTRRRPDDQQAGNCSGEEGNVDRETGTRPTFSRARPDGPDELPGVSGELVALDIDSLVLEGSPRLAGENKSHTRVLAETDTALPPILVHRDSMRVIDGVHRVEAVRLNGQQKIMARYYDGDAEAAFVHAVKANVSHGLPLSLLDRREAAVRILGTFPGWSDRAIAAATGLSASTIRTIRDRATGGSGQSSRRVGRDGRVRPLDFADGRRRAAEVLASRPDASLREIASSAGVSAGTAVDVRRRIQAGEDPVPRGGGSRRRPRTAHDSKTPSSILKALMKDPSLRYSETGRGVVRWLGGHVIDPAEWPPIASAVPPHCAYAIASLAMGCARTWEEFAEALIAQAREVR